MVVDSQLSEQAIRSLIIAQLMQNPAALGGNYQDIDPKLIQNKKGQIAAGIIHNVCRCDCTGGVKCIRQPDNTWFAKCDDCGEAGPAQVNWWAATQVQAAREAERSEAR